MNIIHAFAAVPKAGKKHSKIKTEECTPEKQEKRPLSQKTKGRIGIAFIVGFLLIGAVLGILYAKHWKAQSDVVSAWKKSVIATAKEDDLLHAVYQTEHDGGTVSSILNLAVKSEENTDTTVISLNHINDVRNGIADWKAEASSSGESLLRAAWKCDANKIAFTTGDFAKEDTFLSIDRGNFGEVLNSSIFAGDSSTGFAMNESQTDKILQIFRLISAMDASKFTNLEEVYHRFDVLLNENAKPTKTTDKLVYGNQAIKVTTTTWTLDTDMVEQILNFIKQEFEENVMLRGCLESIGIREEQFSAWINGVKGKEIIWEYAIANGYLVRLNGILRDSGEEVASYSVDFGATPKRGNSFSLQLSLPEKTVQLSRVHSKNDDKEFSTWHYDLDESSYQLLSNLDLEKNTITLTLKMPHDVEAVATGKMTEKEEGVSLNMDSLSVKNSYGTVKPSVNLHLSLRPGEGTVAMPSTTDVKKMTTDQADKILGNGTAFLQNTLTKAVTLKTKLKNMQWQKIPDDNFLSDWEFGNYGTLPMDNT